MKRRIGCWLCGAALLVAWILAAPEIEYWTKLPARNASCQSQLRQIGAAIVDYAKDHDGRLPPAARWEDAIRPYLLNHTFRCPLQRQVKLSGYAFNRLLGGRRLADIADRSKAPLVFTSVKDARNANDGLESFRTVNQRWGNVVFADGTVRRVSEAPSADAGLR